MGFQQKINAFDFVIGLSYSSSLMFFVHQLSSERGAGLGIEASCSGIIEQTKKYKKHRLLQIKRS